MHLVFSKIGTLFKEILYFSFGVVNLKTVTTLPLLVVILITAVYHVTFHLSDYSPGNQ
jgi:hypothetical protein